MEELQTQVLQEDQEKAQLEHQIAQLEAVAKTLLTKEALQRYGNVKAAHPEKAVQLLLVIGQMIHKGNAKKIDDEQLKRMLVMLQPKKKQIKITRK